MTSNLSEVKLLEKKCFQKQSDCTFLVIVLLFCYLVHCYQMVSADRSGERASILSLTIKHHHFTLHQQAR